MLKLTPFTGALHYPKQSCKMCFYFYYSYSFLYFKPFPSSQDLLSSSCIVLFYSLINPARPNQKNVTAGVSISITSRTPFSISTYHPSILQFSHQIIKKESFTSNHFWMVMDFCLMGISPCILQWGVLTEKQDTRVKQAPSTQMAWIWILTLT